jgi:hypothetical protein
MSIREKLSLKALAILDAVRGYLYTSLQAYYLQKAVEHADAFLKRFRSHKADPNNFSAQKKAKPNPPCRHLKGGSTVHKFNPIKDHNIHVHIFSDGRTKIWCGNNCGYAVWNGEEGWKDALYLVESTSNKPSSAERKMWAIDRPGKDTEYVSVKPDGWEG